jgi:predicted HD superfamily hydrolase involved in NAD metabolism
MEVLQQIPRAEEFFGVIENRLKPKTLHHVLGVTELMLKVAPKIGISLEDAAAAGLLHDLCKRLKTDEMLAAAKDYDIPISNAQREKPQLLHGPVAAEEVKRELGVESDAVYEAIYYHTTGKPGLGLVGQALYFADFSEPNRTYAGSAEARALLEVEGFTKALLYAADAKLAHVQTKSTVDPLTQAFNDWLHAEYD